VAIFREVYYVGYIAKTLTFLKRVTKGDRNMQGVYDVYNVIN